MKRAALFIDGPNLWASCQALKVQIDYKKLREYFIKEYDYAEFSYYTAVHTDDDGFQAIRKVLDFISYNGFRVIQKPVRMIDRGEQDALMKGNLDVELAVDMIQSAENFDVLILFSGDGDFAYVIEQIRKRGREVIVFSSIASKHGEPNMASDAIRRAPNKFINLAEVSDQDFNWLIKKHEIQVK